ncbi:hypothetical protein [Acuticoccus mangrovi]|uniref:HD domain-containing protein n=1 Tax=Acuticoccus mangrovi TaxID=2796142 RepID=A0A934INF6_9HYPH|nr:hypothetical protein [Acuticoccus mangrovi]MBJ3774609.1 hypothetical protein [Acuticoccus mangrovi]
MNETTGAPGSTPRPGHPTLEATAAYAASFHAGQLDRAGKPYVDHLIRVAATLARLYPEASIAERHAVWLHGVLVRTSVTAAELAALGYAPEVIEILKAVAPASDDAESDADRIEALAAAGSPAAVRVMIAVLADTDAADMLARLRQALAERPVVIDDADPGPSDMIPVTLSIEPVEHSILQEAAVIAERSLEDFIIEEASGLAHRIVVTGSLSHVELARDRRARNKQLIDMIRNMASP